MKKRHRILGKIRNLIMVGRLGDEDCHVVEIGSGKSKPIYFFGGYFLKKYLHRNVSACAC